MPRYIDADELKKCSYVIEYKDEWHMTKYGEFVELADIENTPTADVRENVHAHWDRVEMKKGEWWHTCSKCKATWGSEDGELDFNFCPNCGAQMEANDGEI